ncbi:hypothetical protein [Lonsdalea quercina]|uniref:hypothetical protein n=1 Tax=Lonsdalea quercina TaxID=71657 RepID=UPI003976AED5
MSFYVGTGYFPAYISSEKINNILESETPPEMSLWEKIKDFFCSTHQGEAQECIYQLCHPPAQTTPEQVKAVFERLQQLTYPGFEHQFKACVNSQHHCGASYFTIEDQNATEVLSVMLFDDYTVTTGKSGYLNMGLTRSYPFA